MARNADAVCIFCEQAPCICHGPAKKKSTARKTKQDQPPVAPEQDTTTPDWFTATPTEPVNRFAERVEDGPSPDELNLQTAIRNLAPILHESELRRHDKIINPPLKADAERRLLDWRQRHGTQ